MMHSTRELSSATGSSQMQFGSRSWTHDSGSSMRGQHSAGALAEADAEAIALAMRAQAHGVAVLERCAPQAAPQRQRCRAVARGLQQARRAAGALAPGAQHRVRVAPAAALCCPWPPAGTPGAEHAPIACWQPGEGGQQGLAPRPHRQRPALGAYLACRLQQTGQRAGGTQWCLAGGAPSRTACPCPAGRPGAGCSLPPCGAQPSAAASSTCVASGPRSCCGFPLTWCLCAASSSACCALLSPPLPWLTPTSHAR